MSKRGTSKLSLTGPTLKKPSGIPYPYHAQPARSPGNGRAVLVGLVRLLARGAAREIAPCDGDRTVEPTYAASAKPSLPEPLELPARQPSEKPLGHEREIDHIFAEKSALTLGREPRHDPTRLLIPTKT